MQFNYCTGNPPTVSVQYEPGNSVCLLVRGIQRLKFDINILRRLYRCKIPYYTITFKDVVIGCKCGYPALLNAMEIHCDIRLIDHPAPRSTGLQ